MYNRVLLTIFLSDYVISDIGIDAFSRRCLREALPANSARPALIGSRYLCQPACVWQCRLRYRAWVLIYRSGAPHFENEVVFLLFFSTTGVTIFVAVDDDPSNSEDARYLPS